MFTVVRNANDLTIEEIESRYVPGKVEFPCNDGKCVEVIKDADNDQ